MDFNLLRTSATSILCLHHSLWITRHFASIQCQNVVRARQERGLLLPFIKLINSRPLPMDIIMTEPAKLRLT